MSTESPETRFESFAEYWAMVTRDTREGRREQGRLYPLLGTVPTDIEPYPTARHALKATAERLEDAAARFGVVGLRASATRDSIDLRGILAGGWERAAAFGALALATTGYPVTLSETTELQEVVSQVGYDVVGITVHVRARHPMTQPAAGNRLAAALAGVRAFGSAPVRHTDEPFD